MVKRLRGATAARSRVVGLTLEFHHRPGDLPRVLTFPFEVEWDAGGAPGG